MKETLIERYYYPRELSTTQRSLILFGSLLAIGTALVLTDSASKTALLLLGTAGLLYSFTAR